MTYEKVCRECGKEFAAAVNHQKFCEDCKAQAYKRGRNRGKVAITADTEEMRELCLRCNRPRCGGMCEELARLARGEV